MTDAAPVQTPAATAPLLFDAVLTPHRSLSPLGFYVVMALMAGACLILGVGFFLMGAWPVVGFFGLDVAALWLAFKLSYRSGRLRETLQLSSHTLTVRRILPSGRAREWRFQPYWLRVEIDQPAEHDSRLTLASHGRRLTIGAFLTVQERVEVAQALRGALGRLRCLPDPLPQT
ncbi:MAG: DUF2244 domain-containing protein [Alphaproteobacteria bacterium]